MAASAPATNPTDQQQEVKFTPYLIAPNETAYETQLNAKKSLVEQQFAELNPPQIEVFRSKPKHYRMRAEFTVWHENDDTFYQMHEKDESTGTMKKIKLEQFPVGSELINELMPRIMAAIRTTPTLRQKLFQANFHTTLAGQSMVTLIYHRKLDDAWTEAAKELRQQLQDIPGASAPPHIIGRSRKQKILLDSNEVEEQLDVPGRGILKYIQVEGAFSQPNASVCTSMLGWAIDVTRGSQDHDLLELYCGNGNFTAAVAPNFRKVVATEVSKSAVDAAKRNFKFNNVENVVVARMSSEEFTQAWRTGKKFNRLADVDLKSFTFETLLVDPPRAGLDDQTRKLLKDFKRVVYISCNPETLKRDVLAVNDVFEISRFAIYDQFPYTHHVECGAYLVRRDIGSDQVAAAVVVENKEEENEEEGRETAKKQRV